MFTTASGLILGLSQSPMRSLPVAVSTWVKWREREADDSLPYNSNIRKAWSYIPYIILRFVFLSMDSTERYVHRDTSDVPLRLLIYYVHLASR